MIARVIVDVESSLVDKIFDYSCFDDVKLGSRVLVPFGNRYIEGYVVELSTSTDVPQDKLKSIIKVLDEQVILPEMLELSKFMIQKYNLKTIDTLRLFLPSGMRNNKIKTLQITNYSLTNDYVSKLGIVKKSAKNQLAIIDFLQKTKSATSVELNSLFCSSSVKRLEELCIINKFFSQKRRKPQVSEIENKQVVLNSLQQNAIDKILAENSKTFLLYGVTGSGKTEVYMHAIKKILEKNKTAIMLVPEISLTPQVMQNFVARFGDNVAILHSGLSNGERFDEWQRIFSGEAKIVVGARSAIFAPIKNLGLIIIDEEHDTSYYSESNPRYSTIEVAQQRAFYNNCNLVLGSATPSIEDYYKAKNGIFELIEMPVRVNRKEMPKVSIVDMQSEIRNGNSSMFSALLMSKLTKKMEKNEQAILFLNRRGYNSFVMCRDCGYCAKCEDCDVSLVYHKEDNQLKCHYCGKKYYMLSECPECHSKYIRYGAIGTQKVVEELKSHFLNVPIFRLDNDTVSTKNGHEKILSEFAKTKPSILVGTQMIAKGHDFPFVTLVGIIDADVSLHFSDYRANERTFDLITQVSGRAGRSDKQGEVVLQTYCPRHYVYKYASEYNYNKFYEREINLRSVTNFPPFANVVRILITSENEQKTMENAKNIYAELLLEKNENPKEFVYLNVMKSPIKRIEKKFRYQILMRLRPDDYSQTMQKIFALTNANKKQDVFVFVEQNPQNLS